LEKHQEPLHFRSLVLLSKTQEVPYVSTIQWFFTVEKIDEMVSSKSMKWLSGN
jgi:hypothetical protein